MIEESASPIRLGKVQLKVLNVLRVTPRPLTPILLFKFLKDRNLFYLSLWRCLQLLERNNLVIKIGNSYSITGKGIKEFNRRKYNE